MAATNDIHLPNHPNQAIDVLQAARLFADLLDWDGTNGPMIVVSYLNRYQVEHSLVKRW